MRMGTAGGRWWRAERELALAARLRWHWAAAFLSIGLFSAGCGPEPRLREAEVTAQTSSAIANGENDTGNLFPWAVAIVREDPPAPGATAAFCSGVLITPVLVATANHCFDANRANDTFNVIINPSLIDFTPDRVFRHSPELSGPVRTFFDPAHDVEGYEHLGDVVDIRGDVLHDIAIFRLDTRVPPEIATPLHPPSILGTPECPSEDFQAANIGFGHRSLFLDEGIPSPLGFVDDSLALVFRSFSTSDEWEFSREEGGGIYRLEEIVALFLELEHTYDGSLGGDSGGPLVQIDTNPPVLCGVASRHVVDFVPPITMASDYTALDEADNLTFVSASAVNPNTGFWDGECRFECSPFARDDDQDGYLDTCCDNCPKERNITQADSDCDANGCDLFGDECDLCPGKMVRDQSGNANLEAELALHFGQNTTQLPSLPTAELVGKIRPDACDPTPVAKPQRGEERMNVVGGVADGGPLPPGTAIDVNAIPGRSARCDLPFLFECVIGAQNRIDLAALGQDVMQNRPGRAGVRHCFCSAEGRNDPLRRNECRTPDFLCLAAQEFTPTPLLGWNRLEIRALGETWPTAQSRYAGGGEYLAQATFGISPVANDGTLFFNFLRLPYVTGVAAGNPRVEGILGVGVTDFETFGAPDAKALANAYVGGDAGVSWFTRPSNTYASIMITRRPNLIVAGIKWPCLTGISCPPFGESHILTIRPDQIFGNPPTSLVAGIGSWYLADEDPAVDVSLRPVLDAVARGIQRYIPASEPSGRLQQAGSSLRAVTLDQQSQLASLLIAGTDGQLRSADFCPSGSGCDEEEAVPNSAIILNAARGRLFSFGDRERRVVQSQIGLSGSQPTLERKEFPLVLSGTPGTILAATWRMDDDSIYAVEKGPLLVRRLLRWRYGSDKFEVVAYWLTALSAYDRMFLGSGPEGDLVLTATQNLGIASAVVRFTVNAQQRLRFAGATEFLEPVVAEPLVAASSVQTLVPDLIKIFRYKSVEFSTLQPNHWRLRPLGCD